MSPKWEDYKEQHMQGLRPYKRVGDIVQFVPAPPRPYLDEDHRCPGMDLLGKRGLVIEVLDGDCYGWGGLYSVLLDGRLISYYGDFMESVCEC